MSKKNAARQCVGTCGLRNQDEFPFYGTPGASISTRASTRSSTRNNRASRSVRKEIAGIVMFRYIVLVVAVGTACAAPASPSISTLESTGKVILPYNLTPESSLPSSAPAPTLALALALAPAPAPAPAPALDPAPASAPALDRALEPSPIPALAAEPQSLPSSSSTAELSAGRSPASAPKALSLLSPIRTPASTTKLTHLIAPLPASIAATPLLPPLQISEYAYVVPALAPLELAAAPSSYSIEQHGYRITY